MFKVVPRRNRIAASCATKIVKRALQYSTVTSSAPEGALQGIKILDLSRVLAAPFCTQILADYGADVVKVENPGKGDDTRYWKIAGEEETWKPQFGPMSNYFAAVNRNKKAITLNLKHQKGREIFLKLVKDVDVVVENFKPGQMEKLNIGYETLAKENPRIILASISGYGSSGQWANRAGYDMIAGAEAGLLHLTGERGRGPVRPGLGLTDMSTGLFMHGAIMGALYTRERTGRGQRIDASLFETQVALLTNVAMSWLNMGREAERWGTQHPSVVPYDAFQTKDMYIVCGATNDDQFANMCKQLGNSDLVKDERFTTNAKRVENRDELFTILRKLFVTKTTAEWLEAFEGSGMPYAAINNMEKVFSHPQTAARDMTATIDFEAAKSGSLELVGPPVKFSHTKASIRTKPPLLGEHTKEILETLGIKDAEYTALQEEKVI